MYCEFLGSLVIDKSRTIGEALALVGAVFIGAFLCSWYFQSMALLVMSWSSSLFFGQSMYLLILLLFLVFMVIFGQVHLVVMYVELVKFLFATVADNGSCTLLCGSRSMVSAHSLWVWLKIKHVKLSFQLLKM